jgi:hypothetical protein
MRDLGDRETQNIFKLEINKILSEIPAKLAEILNPFSSRFFFFFNLTLLGFFNRTLAEPFNNR